MRRKVNNALSVKEKTPDSSLLCAGTILRGFY
jgi:hypothetical protein